MNGRLFGLGPTKQKNLRKKLALRGIRSSPILPKMGRSRPEFPERCHPLTRPYRIWSGSAVLCRTYSGRLIFRPQKQCRLSAYSNTGTRMDSLRQPSICLTWLLAVYVANLKARELKTTRGRMMLICPTWFRCNFLSLSQRAARCFASVSSYE